MIIFIMILIIITITITITITIIIIIIIIDKTTQMLYLPLETLLHAGAEGGVAETQHHLTSSREISVKSL